MMQMSQMIAGQMGRSSNQGAKGRKMSVNVDPMERLNQRMAGRTQGGDVKKKKTKEDRQRRSLLATYGGI
jgi:hypothetical protein